MLDAERFVLQIDLANVFPGVVQVDVSDFEIDASSAGGSQQANSGILRYF